VRQSYEEAGKFADKIVIQTNEIADQIEQLEDRTFELLDNCDEWGRSKIRKAKPEPIAEVQKEAREAIAEVRKHIEESQKQMRLNNCINDKFYRKFTNTMFNGNQAGLNDRKERGGKRRFGRIGMSFSCKSKKCHLGK
jgi:hypothetical protein